MTTIELNITADEIRRGDVFTLHGRTRQASMSAWANAGGHVHIPFTGGGDAVIPADRPITVMRTVADEDAA